MAGTPPEVLQRFLEEHPDLASGAAPEIKDWHHHVIERVFAPRVSRSEADDWTAKTEPRREVLKEQCDFLDQTRTVVVLMPSDFRLAAVGRAGERLMLSSGEVTR